MYGLVEQAFRLWGGTSLKTAAKEAKFTLDRVKLTAPKLG